MILCDTNIFIELFKRKPEIVSEFSNFSGNNICTSVVCKAELYFGAIDKKELLQIEKDISNIKAFQIEPAISQLALELMHKFILSHKVGYSDFLIAATALHHNLELYTLNKKDFRFIPGLKFYK